MDDYKYERFLDQNKFYSRKNVIEDIPGFQLLVKNALLMKDKDKFNEYKYNNLMTININGKTKSISSTLLYDVLTQEGLYKYLITSLDYDSENAVSLLLVEDNLIVDVINITKAELVSAIKQLDLSHLDPSIQMRVGLIFSFTNRNVCINRYTDLTYKCMIDGKEVEKNCIDLIRLLTTPSIDLKKLLKDDYTTAYMLVDFVNNEGILDKYTFDDETYERYQQLKDYQIIDYESINKLNRSDDMQFDGTSTVDQININPSLIEEVYQGMDPRYDVLEKAIYIYIRLCDILTFDEEFYASQSKYEKSGIHNNIENIYAITSEENKIVSFEFMLIYAKFLKELGIKYSLNLNSLLGYSSSKSSIKFKHSEYLVNIDLFDEIIKNDMSMIKIGGSINNIHSYNTNEVTKEKFNSILYNIYESYNNKKQREQEFKDVLDEYNKTYVDTNISFKQKLYVLFKLIGRKDLKGIDSINYIIQIFNNIFKPSDNVNINILAKRFRGHSRPVILINHDNDYYICDPTSVDPLKVIDNNKLDELINKGIYTYISNEEEDTSERTNIK